MYILVSDFFEKKTINTYLKLEICVVFREFLPFKYVFIVFFDKNQMIIYICKSEILKNRVYNRFLVNNIHINFGKKLKVWY